MDDELIIRVLQGTATDSERETLRRWRAASLVHERRYRRLAQVWSLTAAVERHPETSPPTSVERLLAAGRSRTARWIWRVRGSAWVWWGAAAAALVLIGASVVTVARRSPASAGFGGEEFVTGNGETATVSLRDGTVVRLAPDSRLGVNAADHERSVWLEGMAYFAVNRDPRRPFIVHTRSGEARVLGTRFELDAREGSLRLEVVEGRVALSAAGRVVEVGAGQRSRVVGGDAPEIAVDSSPAPPAWVGDLIVFQRTPLASVLEELERRYRIRTQLLDTSLADRRVSAWFSNRPLDEVVTVVCRVVEARCAIGERVVTIGR